MAYEKRAVHSNFSADIVRHLREKEGMTLKQIGELTGLSESFVSRIARGERTFRVDHLTQLEKALKQPLPLLLLETTNSDSLSKDMRKLYDSLRDLFIHSGHLQGIS